MIIQENLTLEGTAWVVETADEAGYAVDTPAATTCLVQYTFKEHPKAEDNVDGATLTFVDNGASNDLITRDKGSWLDGRFRVGQELTIAGGNTNDGTYTILAVSADTIEVATGSFTDETTSTYTATAAIPLTDWLTEETVVADSTSRKEFGVAPTGFRFSRASGTGTIRVWVRS
jgi:hypothetical protein